MTITFGAGAVIGAAATAANAYLASWSAAAVAGSTAAAAGATSTVVGGATVVGTATAAAGTIATVAASTVGLVVVGADETGTTFDCWKPVLHDTSTEPSNGKILKEVIEDPRISRVILQENEPNISLVNIWGEKFDIQYILLPSGQLCAHALRNGFVEIDQRCTK